MMSHGSGRRAGGQRPGRGRIPGVEPSWGRRGRLAALPRSTRASCPYGSLEKLGGGPMSIYDVPIRTIDGGETTLAEHKGKALLIVNVASQCGFTPQYAGLQKLHETYADRGLAVLGFPCNQFGAQEPGSHDEIKTFCETSFGVSFPLFAKIEVNGDHRHPLYAELTKVADADGHAGDIRWNFEKFLVSPDGDEVVRFSTLVTPEDPKLVGAIEDRLPD
jgi:glutathione peroxidase